METTKSIKWQKNWNWVEHAQKLIRPWGIPYKDLTNERPGNRENLAEHEQKFYQALGSPLGINPPSLRSIRPMICTWKLCNQSEANKQREYSGASIKSEGFLNDFTHQVWGHSHQLFIYYAWKLLDTSEARKWWEFSRNWPPTPTRMGPPTNF